MSFLMWPGKKLVTNGSASPTNGASSGSAGAAIPELSLLDLDLDLTDHGRRGVSRDCSADGGGDAELGTTERGSTEQESTATSDAESQPGLRPRVASEQKSLIRGPSRWGRGLSTASRASALEEEEEEGEEENDMPTTDGWCIRSKAHCGKGRGSVCYWCFVIVFFLFVFEFPIFLKWMLMSPMPIQFWNEEYAKFPALEDQQFIKDEGYSQYDITMSPIPQTWTGCNHSCPGADGYSSASSEMSFHVDMKLNAPGFDHTAFPLLMASNDFSNWWLAADKRDSVPRAYFPSHSADVASVYQHVTDDCTRPPVVTDGEVSDIQEKFASAPTYVLVCIAWDSQKVNWHRENAELGLADLGLQCDSIGGVCGWPCESNPSVEGLPGCESGTIDVNTKTGSVAGVEVPNASFSGDVSVKACADPLGSAECTTTSQLMSQWPCHQCKSSTLNQGGKADEELFYDSLPRMEVLLKNLGNVSLHDAVPRAYIMTSSIDPNTNEPAGMTNGTWKKLYDPVPFPLPRPVSLIEDEEELPAQQTTKAPPTSLDASRHKMQFFDQSKVTLKPERCFGQRGPLYLVACAVNSSTYVNEFEFVEGQLLAPPPFNDRCLAVSGRCAYACMDQQGLGLEHCTADGFIPEEDLVKKIDTPTNDDTAVKMFVWTLLFGFAVKLVTYFPGLFIPYKHPKYYDQAMTAELKYIAICAPSGGETKACILRNLVGGFSSLPKNCKCPFHLVFADEGHRHPHKVMFKALVAVLHHVPDTCMNPGSSAPTTRDSGRSYKEDNLKAITKLWVEQTRFCRLEGCNTEKIAKHIKSLRKYLSDPSQPTEEIKKLEKEIDDLAGVTALKTLQTRSGWPKGDASEAIHKLEAALQQLRQELVVGEKSFDGVGVCDEKKPMHLDDCEDYSWPQPSEFDLHPNPLYTLHYVARAKPDEDERILKVQHVARGVWYYKIPKLEDRRNAKSWRAWRQNTLEFTDGDFDTSKYVVPLRTSRGKAGGLNFVENYLFDYTKHLCDPTRFKYALFSIADARHQYQADFMHETIPFFFRKQSRAQRESGQTPEVDTSVAFTQCPQYYPEMPDEVDYLDTNNSNFFRLNCMLRNCCGGVSSCGTGGTWLIRDRRAGIHGTDSIWDMESVETTRQGFEQAIEYTFFHESCKVEDTASSLDRVVKGKHSQYINRRLAYGMAKDPVDYLAAVQRWAEGGVVLSLQTFFGCEQGIHMIWITFGLFLSFVFSLANLVYGSGYLGVLQEVSNLLGGDSLFQALKWIAAGQAEWCINAKITTNVYKDTYTDMFLDVYGWFVTLVIAFLVIAVVTTMSRWFHHFGLVPSCRGRRMKLNRRTRFPTSMAQWARLLITMDNLTYFLWFWTAFFWVGFNYYGVYFQRYYHFDANGMVMFSWMMQVLSWSMVISATCRYRMDQSMAANEVFFLSLTNIWRTTQLFYITAPLTVYSIMMGISDFLRNRMLGVDISYWVGGDRGAVSKSITQWWTLLLVMAMIVTQILFWADYLPNADIVGVLVVTFIGLDVMHPCAFLWLGIEKELLPKPPASDLPTWQRCLRRCVRLIFCLPFWRNVTRAFVFHPRCSLVIQWIGPIQNVMMPVLTIFYPELGINNALLLLASVK